MGPICFIVLTPRFTCSNQPHTTGTKGGGTRGLYFSPVGTAADLFQTQLVTMVTHGGVCQILFWNIERLSAGSYVKHSLGVSGGWGWEGGGVDPVKPAPSAQQGGGVGWGGG